MRAPIAALGFGADGTSALDHYELVIGGDPSGGYGHRVRVEATGVDPEQLSVQWTSEGVLAGPGDTPGEPKARNEFWRDLR